MPAKKIVIVGAGASARFLTKSLQPGKKKGELEITVVQPNLFASLSYYQTLVLTKRETLVGNSTFQEVEGVDKTVYGTAVGCSDGVLAVQQLKENGKDIVEVPFDILVAATGSSLPVVTETPGQSTEERQAEIDMFASALTSGESVVIAGGGAVGVELAGDILEALPVNSRKGKVTLVCSADRLMLDQPASYGEGCKIQLEALGCTILFKDRVTSHSESIVASSGKSVGLELKSGKILECHAYVAAYSRGASTAWLTTPHGEEVGLPSQLLNDRGQVVVNEFLQSTAYEKLFAVAATNDRKEIALFMNVEAEAKTAAANIMKPNSSKALPGLEHAVYQVVGHDTYATLMPENLPMPGCFTTLCCQWCGFPCNLLCPCFCCAAVCGPVDPMTCGYCCGAPEGAGLPKTLMAVKEMGVMAQQAGFINVGQQQQAPSGEDMKR